MTTKTKIRGARVEEVEQPSGTLRSSSAVGAPAGSTIARLAARRRGP